MTTIASPLPLPGSRARVSTRPAPAPARPTAVPRPGQAQFRRRRTAAVLVLAVLAGIGAVGGGLGRMPLTPPGPAPAEQYLPIAERSYVVRPGDTLWQIARALQPAGDVRPLVQWLSTERGGAPLQAGERLTLPPG